VCVRKKKESRVLFVGAGFFSCRKRNEEEGEK